MRDSRLRWLESYLKDGVLMIMYEGSTSPPSTVLSGVPQGYHLGPLLFNAFMNGIGSVITVLLFVDEVKLFSRNSPLSYRANLQESLNNICDWCNANAMELNPSSLFYEVSSPIWKPTTSMVLS